MIRISLALAFSLLCLSAEAKTIKSRIAEVFQSVPFYSPPKPHVLRMRAAPYYYFDHPAFQKMGKGIIVKECPIDIKQDPGEASCKAVWAKI